MPDLPSRPDLVQLRHQAKDLLHAARAGDAAALERVHVVSERVSLASAQLALAREYGFVSWARLKTEVVRRQILDDRDVDRLVALLADEPELATARDRARARAGLPRNVSGYDAENARRARYVRHAGV